MSTDTSAAPVFDDAFYAQLTQLFQWRRDVRRFRSDALPAGAIDELIALAALAPSVGNSQPWRFAKINDGERRRAMRDLFEACNKDALNDYHGAQARLYATLKLSGMDRAPEQLAVFCQPETSTGHGLGRKTMPETMDYSVVGAVQTLWLGARARGIGVGWISIIDPMEAARIIDVPDDWKLIAYLCIGYPEEEHIDPELVRFGWQDRLDPANFTITR
ncbi:5,6-dimethylbenzimidazole synthase [Varunaivibrio sulfuroxidans]|uniref:Cob(II)yrinic acid a,c-diamide reductase n=1 Tax=Varunaivibrio sulfuroxidans TaxID=1773489 RepID=A0A4R3JE61_9PROT|nr:5,6-dimethylbenzimidazole synthase [Varunaivibrio sulfuroxidans]TCS63493.1 cob(II)yrinic acid a,c-diamide reductase [Varunaivibrio sulfuroxidans]WES30362.1 5,6-dimethylbenzimidazole synthase [Varunaivibrio sulfuroxidans]